MGGRALGGRGSHVHRVPATAGHAAPLEAVEFANLVNTRGAAAILPFTEEELSGRYSEASSVEPDESDYATAREESARLSGEGTEPSTSDGSTPEAIAPEGGKITALHVMEPLPRHVAQYLPAQQHDIHVADLKARMAKALGPDAGVASAVIEGHAGRAIVEFAEDIGADLIVVASHRPGLQDYLLGSTAARVVRHAQACVHVLR